MAELKTRPTGASVEGFLDELPNWILRPRVCFPYWK